VGYVHALSHQLSGAYGTVHGVGNGALMPLVLEKFGPAIYPQLADLGRAAQIPGWNQGTDEDKAKRFIAAVRNLVFRVGMPDYLPEIKDADIPDLAKRAAKEGNPLYPVPVIWQLPDFEEVYRAVKKPPTSAAETTAASDKDPGVGSANTGPAAREGFNDPQGYDDSGADGSGIDVDAPEKVGTVDPS